MSAPLQLHTIVSMPFAENTYVAWLPGQTACLVVDPGLEPEEILQFLQGQGLTPAVILNTHGHVDHIAGNAALKAAYPAAPLLIGAGDAPMLTDPMANLSAPFGDAVVSPEADRLVREGDVLEFAGFKLDVLDLPGHSPGHVVYLCWQPGPLVFGGDVLFREGIGRSDFPGGDHLRLLEGIQTKLFTLPDTVVVYPGHGPVTTVGHEKRHNPFLT
jgi:glyoxylase-like metal-dependent hydrolase (beta-lactamase superfamily II)